MVLKKLTLMLVSALFGLCLSILIVGLGLQMLLYPEVYENALEQNDIYDYVEQQIAARGIIPETLFVQYGVKATVNKFIRRSLVYVRGEEENLNLTLQFNDTVLTFFDKRIDSLKVCKPGQLPVSDKNIICKPEDLNSKEFAEFIFGQQGMDINQFSTINLADVLGLEKILSPVREGVRIFRKVLIASLALSIFFLLMIVLLNRKSISSITRWVDTELFIVSLSMITSSYFLKKYLPDNIPLEIDALHGFIIQIVFTILDIMTYYSVIILIVAITLMVAAFIFSKKSTHNRK